METQGNKATREDVATAYITAMAQRRVELGDDVWMTLPGFSGYAHMNEDGSFALYQSLVGSPDLKQDV